jgi:hypothetical protein
VGCAPKVYLAIEGPLDLRLTCTDKVRSKLPRCTRNVTLRLPRVAARPNVEVTASRNGKRVARATGKRELRISFRRPTRKAFTVEVAARSEGDAPAVGLSIARRVGACRR